MHKLWKKTHKYNAKKVRTADGKIFDSKKEAKRYLELKLLERAGKIKELKTQPKFLLFETMRIENRTLRKMYYIADFEYIDEQGRRVVEDVKGFRTKDYNVKIRAFREKYPDVIFKEI